MPFSQPPDVIIIGAGFTGCAIAYDLALRGLKATVLERGEIASGTSGRTHGLLHSGGRYCVTDGEAGIECIEENRTLRRIASQCIEFNRGLFVALNDSDLAYATAFEKGAQDCGIEIERLTPAQALAMEPALNPRILVAYTVPDGSFDPLRLAFAFAASARARGAIFHPYHEVEGLIVNGQSNVTGVKVWDRTTGQHYQLSADLVVNATGAWAGKLAKEAGADVPVIPTPGVMVAYEGRTIQHVVNRLNEPGDGDIIIPQRRMAVIGTTSFEVEDPDYIPVDRAQVEQMHRAAFELVPALAQARVRGAYMSARPLIAAGGPGRSLSRTFKCYDHQASEGIGGLVTITGGKATTCRAMAEKTADLVCARLGISARCETREHVLASYRTFFCP